MVTIFSAIKKAKVSYEGGSMSPTAIEVSEEEETLKLTLPHPLHAGQLATVKYTFTGILNDNLMGLYRSKYTINGQQR
jgi:Peptidase M1 N-terminal domain